MIFFFTDVNRIVGVKDALIKEGYSNVFTCPQGKLFTYKKDATKVQLINTREYKDTLDLISSFDIVACVASWDGETLLKNKGFVFDVLHKKLNIQTVEYPVATMSRIQKYVQKGYKLTNKAKLDFIKHVNSMELDEDNLALYID